MGERRAAHPPRGVLGSCRRRGRESWGHGKEAVGFPTVRTCRPINVLSLEFLFWLSGQSRQMWAALPLGLTPSGASRVSWESRGRCHLATCPRVSQLTLGASVTASVKCRKGRKTALQRLRSFLLPRPRILPAPGQGGRPAGGEERHGARRPPADSFSALQDAMQGGVRPGGSCHCLRTGTVQQEGVFSLCKDLPWTSEKLGPLLPSPRTQVMTNPPRTQLLETSVSPAPQGYVRMSSSPTGNPTGPVLGGRVSGVHVLPQCRCSWRELGAGHSQVSREPGVFAFWYLGHESHVPSLPGAVMTGAVSPTQ